MPAELSSTASDSSLEHPRVLEVRGLCAAYGSSQVLFDVNLSVPGSGVVAILGRNGAGKTTLLNTIVGVMHPTAGAVTVHGRETTRFSTDAMVRLGVGYVPQEQNVFASLSVMDNLRVGSLPSRAGRGSMERVFDLFPVLKKRVGQRAGTLSGGERKMLAIGRALLGNPSLLLLDEPTEGVWPAVVAEISEALKGLSQTCAVVLVEQHVAMALSTAQAAYVLDRGRVVLHGPATEIERDPSLYRYLTP